MNNSLNILSVFVLMILCGTNLSAQNQEKKKQALPEGVRVLKDIEYANHNDIPLKLDLYLPEEIQGNVPVIVFIHGGGWKNGSKESGKRGA